MSLPTDSQSNLNLEQQRKRAKDLRRAHREGAVEAALRIARHLPRARNQSAAEVLNSPFTLSEAQFVVAREAGFTSWPAMKHQIEGPPSDDDREALIDASFAGNDDAVGTILERDKMAPRQSIYVAAAIADADAVFSLLGADPSIAERRGGRRDWTPLLYLCCSRYRFNEPDATAARVLIARRLIELGADVNAIGNEPGFIADSVSIFDEGNQAIEGAAGRVASPELVQLLLQAGAELEKTAKVLVRAVSGGNIDVLRLLLDASRKRFAVLAAATGNDELTLENWYQIRQAIRASVFLNRPEMARMLVANAAQPIEQAVVEAIQLERDTEMIGILLGDDRSEFSRTVKQNSYRQAVRYGHRAAAELLLSRGADEGDLTPLDRVIGACIMGDRAEFRRLLDDSPISKSALGEGEHWMLAWAIRSGRHQAVPLLLEAGLDPNVPDKDGQMPLHLAVQSASLELVEMLLQAGAAVDARNFDAQTALEIALANRSLEIRERFARILLDAGASPGRMSQFAPTTPERRGGIDEELREGGAVEHEDPAVLFERAADAVAFGDLEALREMLDDEPALVHARSPRPHRCTLLHYCGANGTEAPRQQTPGNAPAIAQLLLEYGAEPDATCNLYGGGSSTMGLMLTSIHPKAAGVDGDLVRVLARFGAKLVADDLIYAIDSGARLAVAAMVEAGVPVDNLFVAAGLDRLDVMEDVLSRGADINARASSWYSTALHAAAGMGQKSAVIFLLRRGADTSLHNVWEATPADTARHFDHPEIAELIEKSAAS